MGDGIFDVTTWGCAKYGLALASKERTLLRLGAQP